MLNKRQKKRAVELLNGHYRFYLDYVAKNSEYWKEQKAYYDGMYVAFDEMLMGTGEVIVRDDYGWHGIEKRCE